MIRLTLLILSVAFLSAGCSRVTGIESAAPMTGALQAEADRDASDDARGAAEEAQTPIVRSLIEVIDESKGEDGDVKGDLKESLLESDKELRQVLGGNSRRLIMEANKKPPTPVIGGARSPVTEGAEAEKPSVEEGAARRVPQRAPDAAKDSRQAASAEPDEAKTRIIRTLVELIDQLKGEKQEVKDELKKSLIEADEQLSQVLGDNSKRLIMQANRKPPVLVIGGAAKPVAEAGEPKKPEETGEAKPDSAEPEADAADHREPSVPAQPREAKTRIVRSLIEVIGQLKGEKQEVKDELERSLLDADKELSEVLGDNSKRRIMEANKKPPARMVVPERTPSGT